VIVQPAAGVGYSDSQGLFAARKAIMQYTRRRVFAGVELDDVYSATACPSDRDGDAGPARTTATRLVPAPDYPLWTAA